MSRSAARNQNLTGPASGPLSMYEASIPVFIRVLESLSNIIDKAALYADGRKIDHAVLVNARLAPDMFPFSRQIQIATDGVKGCAARLAGIEIPSYADTETTFTELKARLAKTIDFLKTVTPDRIDGTEGKKISLKIGGNDMNFEGRPYLLGFVLPNLYFHASIAYAILRHNGVDLGKKDFLNLG